MFRNKTTQQISISNILLAILLGVALIFCGASLALAKGDGDGDGDGDTSTGGFLGGFTSFGDMFDGGGPGASGGGFSGGPFGGGRSTGSTSGPPEPGDWGDGDGDGDGDVGVVVAQVDLQAELNASSTVDSYGNATFTGSVDVERNQSALRRSISETITNELHVDDGCNQDVDDRYEFVTNVIMPVSHDDATFAFSIEHTFDEPGSHCYRLSVDEGEEMHEVDENNNQTAWQTISVPVIDDQIATTTPVVDPEPEPEPDPGEVIPDIVIIESPIEFAVQVTNASGTVVQDWVETAAITVAEDEELAFRWDGSAYTSCLAFLFPTTYVFDPTITNTSGNTAGDNIDLRTLDATYSIECTERNDVMVASIVVNTVAGPVIRE